MNLLPNNIYEDIQKLTLIINALRLQNGGWVLMDKPIINTGYL